MRQLELTPSSVSYHDADGALRSRDTSFTFATAFDSGDRIDLVPSDSYERVVRPFPIGPGTVLGPGEYDWRALTLNVRSYNGRTVSSNASVSVGSFYDGDKTTLTLSGDVRPNKMLSVNPSYPINDVHLLAGGFVTHLLGLRANLSFSTNLLTSVYVQYNSAGQLAGRGPRELHFSNHRQCLHRFQQDPIHRGRLRREGEQVAGLESHVIRRPTCESVTLTS